MITANCVAGGINFVILLGGGNTEVSTDIVWVHPGYDEMDFSDNIALLELKEPVEFTEEIQAAALPEVGEVVEGGDLLTVCLYESYDSMVCLENVPVLGHEECSALFPGLDSIFCLLSTAETCLVRILGVLNNILIEVGVVRASLPSSMLEMRMSFL